MTATLILKKAAVVGIGPHDREYELGRHAGQPIEVIDASMSGKSTRSVVHYAALTGLNAEGKPWKAGQFRHLPARIVATTAGGKELVREWRETKAGVEQTIRLAGKAITQPALTELVGIYTDPIVTRAVLIPGAWQGLLRDLILQTAGKTGAASQRQTDALCLSRVQAGGDWTEGDSVTLEGATKARKDTQRALAVAEGELRAAERATEEAQLPLKVIGEKELSNAARVVAAQESWDDYTRKLAAYRLWARYVDAVSALGDEPPDVSADLSEANERREKAISAYRIASGAYAAAESMARDADRLLEGAKKGAAGSPPAEPRELTLLLAQIADLESGKIDDTCPTCGRAGAVAVRAARLRELRERAHPLDQAHRTALEEWKTKAESEKAADIEAKLAIARGASNNLETARRALDSAEAEGKAARAELDRLTAASKARSAWLESRNRLVKPAEASKPEPVEQPDPREVEEARAVIAAGPVDEHRTAEREARIAAAKVAEDKAREEYQALGIEVARLVRLEEAWKTAPSKLLPAAVERFNEFLTQAVRVVVEDGALVVQVHGRAVSTFGQTSGGEGVLADVAIRAGLRDLYGLLLPVYADEANRWSTSKNRGAGALVKDWSETGISGLCLLATP